MRSAQITVFFKEDQDMTAEDLCTRTFMKFSPDVQTVHVLTDEAESYIMEDAG